MYAFEIFCFSTYSISFHRNSYYDSFYLFVFTPIYSISFNKILFHKSKFYTKIFNTETRSMLQKRFLEFVRKLSHEEIHRKLMQMEDPREEGEVRRAEDLLTLLLHYDDNVKVLSVRLSVTFN